MPVVESFIPKKETGSDLKIPPWGEVESSPEYQSATDEEKKNMRSIYNNALLLSGQEPEKEQLKPIVPPEELGIPHWRDVVASNDYQTADWKTRNTMKKLYEEQAGYPVEQQLSPSRRGLLGEFVAGGFESSALGEQLAGTIGEGERTYPTDIFGSTARMAGTALWDTPYMIAGGIAGSMTGIPGAGSFTSLFLPEYIRQYYRSKNLGKIPEHPQKEITRDMRKLGPTAGFMGVGGYYRPAYAPPEETEPDRRAVTEAQIEEYSNILKQATVMGVTGIVMGGISKQLHAGPGIELYDELIQQLNKGAAGNKAAAAAVESISADWERKSVGSMPLQKWAKQIVELLKSEKYDAAINLSKRVTRTARFVVPLARTVGEVVPLVGIPALAEGRIPEGEEMISGILGAKIAGAAMRAPTAIKQRITRYYNGQTGPILNPVMSVIRRANKDVIDYPEAAKRAVRAGVSEAIAMEQDYRYRYFALESTHPELVELAKAEVLAQEPFEEQTRLRLAEVRERKQAEKKNLIEQRYNEQLELENPLTEKRKDIELEILMQRGKSDPREPRQMLHTKLAKMLFKPVSKEYRKSAAIMQKFLDYAKSPSPKEFAVNDVKKMIKEMGIDWGVARHGGGTMGYTFVGEPKMWIGSMYGRWTPFHELAHILFESKGRGAGELESYWPHTDAQGNPTDQWGAYGPGSAGEWKKLEDAGLWHHTDWLSLEDNFISKQSRDSFQQTGQHKPDSDDVRRARQAWEYYTNQTERYARLVKLFVQKNAEFKSVAPGLYNKIETLFQESIPMITYWRYAKEQFPDLYKMVGQRTTPSGKKAKGITQVQDIPEMIAGELSDRVFRKMVGRAKEQEIPVPLEWLTELDIPSESYGVKPRERDIVAQDVYDALDQSSQVHKIRMSDTLKDILAEEDMLLREILAKEGTMDPVRERFERQVVNHIEEFFVKRPLFINEKYDDPVNHLMNMLRDENSSHLEFRERWRKVFDSEPINEKNVTEFVQDIIARYPNTDIANSLKNTKFYRYKERGVKRPVNVTSELEFALFNMEIYQNYGQNYRGVKRLYHLANPDDPKATALPSLIAAAGGKYDKPLKRPEMGGAYWYEGIYKYTPGYVPTKKLLAQFNEAYFMQNEFSRNVYAAGPEVLKKMTPLGQRKGGTHEGVGKGVGGEIVKNEMKVFVPESLQPYTIVTEDGTYAAQNLYPGKRLVQVKVPTADLWHTGEPHQFIYLPSAKSVEAWAQGRKPFSVMMPKQLNTYNQTVAYIAMLNEMGFAKRHMKEVMMPKPGEKVKLETKELELDGKTGKLDQPDAVIVEEFDANTILNTNVKSSISAQYLSILQEKFRTAKTQMRTMSSLEQGQWFWEKVWPEYRQAVIEAEADAIKMFLSWGKDSEPYFKGLNKESREAIYYAMTASDERMVEFFKAIKYENPRDPGYKNVGTSMNEDGEMVFNSYNILRTDQEVRAAKYLTEKYSQLLDIINQARRSYGRSDIVPWGTTGAYSPLMQKKIGVVQNLLAMIADGYDVLRLPTDKVMSILDEGYNPEKVMAREVTFVNLRHRAFRADIIETDSKFLYDKYLRTAAKYTHISPLAGMMMDALSVTEVNGRPFDLVGSSAGAQDMYRRIVSDMNFIQLGHRGVETKPNVIQTPKGYEDFRRMLLWAQKNVVASLIAFNPNVVVNQLPAMKNTLIYLGPKATFSAVMHLMNIFKYPGKIKQIFQESDVMYGRWYNPYHELDSTWGRARKAVVDVGSVLMRTADIALAASTYLAAKEKYLKMNPNRTLEAIDYANTIVSKSQASTFAIDKAPVQRGVLGVALTTFANYSIAEWNTMTRDVFGYQMNMSPGQKIMNGVSWAVAVALINHLYEQVFGMESMYAAPEQRLIEMLEQGRSTSEVAFSVGSELLKLYPLLQGSRMGGSLTGATVSMFDNMLRGSADIKYVDKAIWSMLYAVSPIPGASGIRRVWNAYRQDKPLASYFLNRKDFKDSGSEAGVWRNP